MKTYITKIDGKWYAFAASFSKNQVYSIGADDPQGGHWFASFTPSGVKYVASPSPTRKAAYAKAKRWGDYSGEI